jgi:hypothetical protein
LTTKTLTTKTQKEHKGQEADREEGLKPKNICGFCVLLCVFVVKPVFPSA